MKSRPLYLFYLSMLLTFTLLTFSKGASISKNYSTKHEYDIQHSLTIDLENLMGLTLPTQIDIDSSSCQVRAPSLLAFSNFILDGTVANGGKAFHYKDMYYVLQVDPENNEIKASSYKQNTTGIIIAPHDNYTFASGSSTEPEIFDSQFIDNIGIFSTSSDLIILEFGGDAGPEFIGEFPFHKSPVQAFGIIEDSTLYAAGEDAIVAYDIQGIATVNIRILTTFTGYLLPDGQKEDIGTVQAMCVCQNVLFIAKKNELLVVKQVPNMFATETLPVVRVLKTRDDIIQVKRAGRSLIVLTKKEVIEYVFTKDCLDYSENLRLQNMLFELDPLAALEGVSPHDLKVSDQGRYFAVINKLKSSVFIVEASAIHEPGKPVQPFFIYRSENGIDSLDLFEYSDKEGNGLMLVFKQNDSKVKVAKLLRRPLRLDCSSWRAKSEVLKVQATSKFCQNTVYKSNENASLNSSQPCQRDITLYLNYEWTTGMRVVIVCVVLLFVVALVIVVKLARKKKIMKSFGHRRFYNDKMNASQISNRIDISSLSLPAEERKDSDTNDDKKDATPQGKKKSYSKKKNLTIKIPEN